MTIEEFDQKAFNIVTKIKYKGEIYSINSVSFDEKLIGLDDSQIDDEILTLWVRCENCEIIK
jgi:hypothetical protein